MESPEAAVQDLDLAAFPANPAACHRGRAFLGGPELLLPLLSRTGLDKTRGRVDQHSSFADAFDNGGLNGAIRIARTAFCYYQFDDSNGCA